MTDRTPFQQALRAELLRAAADGPRRRRWRWVAAVAAAVAAVGGGLALGSSPATADVEVRFVAGRVEVLLVDETATVEEVREGLEAAGLRVRVDEQPAGPSSVGKFVSVAFDGPAEQVVNIDGLDSGPTAFTDFSLNRRWEGTLVVSLGRPARPGEVYTVSSDAFAEDEPLHCSGILGATLAAGRDELEGFDVRIEPSPDGRIGPLLDLDGAAVEEYGSWIITAADALSPDDLIVHLQPTVPSPEPEEEEC